MTTRAVFRRYRLKSVTGEGGGLALALCVLVTRLA